MRRPLLVLLPLLCASCFSDCQFRSDPQSIIDRLRVIGVVAEPAEIVWGIDSDPELVKVTPLVIDPKGDGREVSVTFRYCRPLTRTPEFRQVSDLPPIIGPAELDCPHEDEPELHAADGGSAWFDALAAVRHYGKPSPADGGLPPGLPVPPGGISVLEGIALYRVGFDVQAGDERIRGYKSLRPTLFAPNQNPVLRDVEIDGVSLDQDPLLSVAMGQPHTLRAIPDPASFERYDLGDGERIERLSYSFHATAGTMELRARERFDAGIDLDDPRAAWQPPADDPLTDFKVPEEGMVVTFHIVVRDDRGGTGYISRRIMVRRGGAAPGPGQ